MRQDVKWIGTGQHNPRDNSLPPELFRRSFNLDSLPEKAILRVTAMGIYEATVNGQKAGDAWFTPGYTHYQTYVQEESYEVTELLLPGENRLDITVANGWWMGSIGNQNNLYGDHRGLRASLRLCYADGREQILHTDENWQWTDDTPIRYADFYNGETIDLTRADESSWRWHPVQILGSFLPEVRDHDSAFVRVRQELTPVRLQTGVYDFGQNHAGVLHLKVRGRKGDVLTIRHAEILNADGGLFTENLRNARQTLTLVCGHDGEQTFSPRFTFMGFRYAEVQADADVEILDIRSQVLTSDCEIIGSFSCSNPLLNRLYENTQWGQASNFIDIPTDCPQRDERMGWTGDIAVFAETASFNRNIHDFMRKWLRDLRLDQRPDGAIPVVIPENSVYQPKHRVFPIAIWGDAATMVPWAVFQAYGDTDLLREQYPGMKAYVDAELRAAARLSFGWRRHLWNRNPFQYGDWCAPGESYYQWIRKGRHLSTAFMAHSVHIVSCAAKALGYAEDAAHYEQELCQIRNAFVRDEWTSGGRLKGDFASNYVCALYFDILPAERKKQAAARLAELVRQNGYRIMTGFAGTPYLLFALADNGYAEDAYKVLLNEECPGWLFTVKAGATTMWERWDALNADGTIKADTIPDMVSFNHYAYGAVGAFFYRRILGIEPLSPGFSQFRVQPVIGGGLTHAEGRIGEIAVSWRMTNGLLDLTVQVPQGKTASIVLPSGKTWTVSGGMFHEQEAMD